MAEKKKDKNKEPLPTTAEGRATALKNALRKIEKDYGKGSIMKLGQNKPPSSIEVIPTGSLSLDVALGVGGLPKGRIIEIYGPESGGKTTLSLHIVAQAQKSGGTAAFIDAEHALDPIYAKKIGVNIDELYISQPDDGEQALDITETMVRSGAVDLIIVDSVAALVPKAEINGEMGDSHVGMQARLMSQALRKLTGITAKSKCIVIFINQLREKIGVPFGNPEVTTGGKALKFYASIRIDIRGSDKITKGNDVLGKRTKAKVAKNKVAPPFKVAEFDIMFGEGISREGDVLDLGADLDIVIKGGAWYSYGERRLGQGRENAKNYLRNNPDVFREIENAVRRHYNLPELDAIEEANKEASKEVNAVSEEEINIDDNQDIDMALDISLSDIDDEIKLEPDDDVEDFSGDDF